MVRLFWVLLVLLLCEISYVFGCEAAPCAQRVDFGKHKTRGLFTEVMRRGGPAVILVPGSGPQSPEVRIPKDLTTDGKEISLFDQLARPFNRAGFHTLAIGKPGVEFFANWNPETFFYDKKLYAGLEWNDLVTNVGEAVAWLTQQASVDAERIFVLGHSEGTQVAVDFAAGNPRVKALALLGYAGENLKTIVDWQLFHRNIDGFVKSDVDANKDGWVTKAEADLWPEFNWPWKEGETKVAVTAIEKWQRDTHAPIYEAIKNSPLYGSGVFERPALYGKTAALPMPVHIYNGALDIQTPPRWATPQAEACRLKGKSDCFVTLLPGLGHGFSPPKAPHFHPIANLTIGPVQESFADTLEKLARQWLGD